MHDQYYWEFIKDKLCNNLVGHLFNSHITYENKEIRCTPQFVLIFRYNLFRLLTEEDSYILLLLFCVLSQWWLGKVAYCFRRSLRISTECTSNTDPSLRQSFTGFWRKPMSKYRWQWEIHFVFGNKLWR